MISDGKVYDAATLCFTAFDFVLFFFFSNVLYCAAKK